MARKRRLRAACVGTALALILLELVLQVASYIAWSRQAQVERPSGRAMLCIGDSLTFGLGAEPEESYPTQLQAKLAVRGKEWSVVNAGIPGQCSADILERLPSLLHQLNPEAVCLLVGWNDTWARPDKLDASQIGDAGFPLRFRTARLISLLLAQTDELKADDATESPPFLGTWHVANYEFYFGADGSARLGTQPAVWSVDGAVLQITPQGGEAFPLRWRVAEGVLEFALMKWSRFQRARPGPPANGTAFETLQDLVRNRHHREAIAQIPKGDGEAAIAARAFIVRTMSTTGHAAAANDLIAQLESTFASDEDPAAGEALALWQHHSNNDKAAIVTARQVLRSNKDRTGCWQVLVDTATQEQREGLIAELQAAIDGSRSVWRQAEMTLEIAILRAPHDAKAAILTTVQARKMGIGSDQTIAAMSRAVALGADSEPLLAALDQATIAPEERLALRSDVRRGTVDDTTMYAVLEQHLHTAIDIIEASGSRAFLLGYPFSMPRHQETVQRVASARGVTFISTVEVFTDAVAPGSRSDWFVDLIHCTAKGYALMAETAAERLAEELR